MSNVNKMNGLMIDGSWELRVLVTDLQVERTLRVKSELHIGGVMIQLVDELGKHLPTPSAPADSIKFAFDNRFRICPLGGISFVCLFCCCGWQRQNTEVEIT